MKEIKLDKLPPTISREEFLELWRMETKWKYVLAGIDGGIIPREAISYEGELKDYNILENSTGKAIMYHTKDQYGEEGFVIITDDPCNVWLTEEDIDSQWTKVKDDNITYCIKQALKTVKE